MLDLEHIFTYHAPRADQLLKYEEIRSAAKTFAQVLVRCTTPGADQDAAVRHIREACWTANGSVALDGRLVFWNTAA
jgi:hypothetical protein